MGPQEFTSWLASLEKFYGASPQRESDILSEIYRVESGKIIARFARNSGINALKSKLLKWCFRCTLGALMLNLATIFVLYLRS
jgi:hypothetical protein